VQARGDAKRQLLVTDEICDLLDGKTKFGRFPNVAAERIIGIFSAGHLIRISRKKNTKRPELERLEGYDDVWSLCLRIPPPGWRLLGRFYSKDRLVLLRAWDKHDLFTKYDVAAREVIEDWIKIFGTADCHRGQELSEYLSGVIRDVDVE
jgi:hypothetical protein